MKTIENRLKTSGNQWETNENWWKPMENQCIKDPYDEQEIKKCSVLHKIWYPA